jgi:hypothetical protein
MSSLNKINKDINNYKFTINENNINDKDNNNNSHLNVQ